MGQVPITFYGIFFVRLSYEKKKSWDCHKIIVWYNLTIKEEKK